MKKQLGIILVLLLLAFQWGFAGEKPQRPVNWDAFAENLMVALSSSNKGLQQAALRHSIRYADQLNMTDAAFDIIGIYKLNRERAMRQLALVALYHLDHSYGNYFLSRSLRFESDPVLRRHISNILAARRDRGPELSQPPASVTLNQLFQ